MMTHFQHTEYYSSFRYTHQLNLNNLLQINNLFHHLVLLLDGVHQVHASLLISNLNIVSSSHRNHPNERMCKENLHFFHMIFFHSNLVYCRYFNWSQNCSNCVQNLKTFLNFSKLIKVVHFKLFLLELPLFH